MMFKCSIGVLPSPVSGPFQYNSVIHTDNTRSKFIHTPIGRSEVIKCKVGCYIDNLCVNHVMYADDIWPLVLQLCKN